MAFEVQDFEALVRLLDAHPEWLEALQERIVDEKAVLRLLDRHPELLDAVRRRILQDEFLQLPALVRQLIESQQRHEAILQEHTRILQEHSRILQEHTQQLARLIEVQARHEAILQEHTQQLARLIEVQERHETQLQQLTEAQRRTEAELRALAEAQRRTEAQVQELVEAQRRTEAQVQELIEAQRRTEAQMQALIEAQRRTEAQVQELVEAQARFEQWRIGEDGRRRGEQLERMTLRRAVNLFNGGQGGNAESPRVRQRLVRWLRQLGDESGWRDADADPTLADILWWKGERVFVGEVSAQVDLRDVTRAIRRTETLRRAGVNATPFVLGEGWATLEAQEHAAANGVEWFVGGDISEGFVEFRRLPSNDEDADADDEALA